MFRFGPRDLELLNHQIQPYQKIAGDALPSLQPLEPLGLAVNWALAASKSYIISPVSSGSLPKKKPS